MTPAKRFMDILLALLFGAVLLPAIGLIAALVLIRDGRPVFYGSERMRGIDRAFTLWKFRTMRHDPGDWGVSGGDKTARITPLGTWLRRRRLDELPQIWNILRGDMSFVGPRPPLRRYVELRPDLYARVLQRRPGVTGLATLLYHPAEERILARCHSPEETDATYLARCVPAKARLDLIWMHNHSLCFDLRLIWITAARAMGAAPFGLSRQRNRTARRP